MSGERKKPKVKPAAAKRNKSASDSAKPDVVSVWLRLMACYNLIQGEIRARLRDEFETTLPRFDILAQIDRSPVGPTMGELSQRLLVTKANITDLMGRLEAEDLVYRQKSETDSRVSHVYLTPKGKKALEVMLKAHKAWLAELMGSLDPEDMNSLSGALGRLKSQLKDK
jgi:DNA-binding MarR family transcriptional regulator